MAGKFKSPMSMDSTPRVKKFYTGTQKRFHRCSGTKGQGFASMSQDNEHLNRETKPNGIPLITSLLWERQALPIYSVKEKVVQEVRRSKSIIIVGETASGKTTQIPQFLYQSELGRQGVIACTQPRRVAAVTIAERVAKETSTAVGELVGYCVRFEDCTSAKTKIKYMTDGMLMRESVGDRLLMKYSVILLDEAHERTIHTDVLLGIVKAAQKERASKGMRRLRIIIMSATMDVDNFSKYFDEAPVLYVEGRLHKIEIFYTEDKQSDYLQSSMVTIFQIHQAAPPKEDILVFLTGQEEIEAIARTIKNISKSLSLSLPKLIVCPLYASLAKHQQLEPFRPTPANCRKIVLSTNLAETSVTIKGIKYVVDSGKVKVKSFLPNTGLDVLAVQKISKAQAWQRAGRAGRERSGVVYRLYTEKEYSSFDEMSKPEILKCNLASVVLNLLAIGIRDIHKFDFIDAPSKESLSDAFDQLVALGAVSRYGTSGHILTDMGRRMAVFPVDPKLSRLILAADDEGCVHEALNLVALLSVDNVLCSPHTQHEEAATAKMKFTSSEGDHIMLMNVYNEFRKAKGNADWCRDNFVNFRSLVTVTKIRKQLIELCQKADVHEVTSNRSDKTNLRRAITSGMFMNAAELQKDNTYKVLSTGQTVHIHPSSCLFRSKPAYVVYNSLIRSSKCFIRDICVVDPHWLYDVSPDFFRRRFRLD